MKTAASIFDGNLHERVLVTGGRNFNKRQAMIDWLDKQDGHGKTIIFCHGGARGADNMFGKLAEERGYEVIPYRVITEIDGPWPAAGTYRNERMLRNFKPTRAVAFPDPQSRGTWDMVRKLQAADVPYEVVNAYEASR